MSRSAAVVIAYLIYTHNMSYDAALDLVKRKRACVKPNSGFVRYALSLPSLLVAVAHYDGYVCRCLQEWERQWRPPAGERPSMRRAQTTPR